MKDELLKTAISSLPKEVQKDFWARVWQFEDDIITEALNYKNENNE